MHDRLVPETRGSAAGSVDARHWRCTQDLIAVKRLLGQAKPETTAVNARVPYGAFLTAASAAGGWRPSAR